MITDRSNFYCICPFDTEGNRLDFVYHHPDLEPVRSFRHGDTIELGSIITEPEYGLSESGLSEGSVGFLNIQHITSRGRVIFDPPAFLKECEERDLLQQGDILIARTGHTLGKATLIPAEFAGYSFGSFCIRFSLLPNVGFRRDFVVRFINSQIGQRQILMLKSGSGKYNINSSQIQDIRIPPLEPPRQDEVITTIRTIESEAIALERRASEIRASIQKWLLRELGLDIALSGTTKFFFKTGAEKQTLWFPVLPDEVTNRLHYLFFHPQHQILNTLQERYHTVSLGEISGEPIVRGEQPEYDECGDVTVLKTVDLKNGQVDFENALKVAADFFEAHPSAQVRRGDILIASTGYGSMGKVDVYDRDEPAMVDGHISIVRVIGEYDPYFIACFLRSVFGQLEFEKWFTGSSGQIEVQPHDLEKFRIPKSSVDGIPLGEQQRLAHAMIQEFDEAELLEQQAARKWQDAKKVFEDLLSVMVVPHTA